MINDGERAKLHKQFAKYWLEEGLTLDEALAKLSCEAGIDWIGNEKNNRVPDSKEIEGRWKVFDEEAFLIWKMKN